MKMIIDRKKMGKNLNFYFQIFMIIVFMGLFVFNRFESKRPEKEIVEYYKECFIKHGWKYDGCRDNIDYSNHSKIENVYLFNKGIYELTLNFYQSDLLDEQVIRQKKPLKYYITVHPKRSY